MRWAPPPPILFVQFHGSHHHCRPIVHLRGWARSLTWCVRQGSVSQYYSQRKLFHEGNSILSLHLCSHSNDFMSENQKKTRRGFFPSSTLRHHTNRVLLLIVKETEVRIECREVEMGGETSLHCVSLTHRPPHLSPYEMR